MSALKTKEPTLVELKAYPDERGFFLESFSKQVQEALGLERGHFVQDNHSYSTNSVLRGMHYQTEPGQDKLIYVLLGDVYDVVVDIRKDSPTFGQWQSFHLSSKIPSVLFVPHGFAHGFLVLSEEAHVVYKVSSFYNEQTERSFHPLDKQVGIKWPLESPLLSRRDQEAEPFSQVKGLSV